MSGFLSRRNSSRLLGRQVITLHRISPPLGDFHQKKEKNVLPSHFFWAETSRPCFCLLPPTRFSCMLACVFLRAGAVMPSTAAHQNSLKTNTSLFKNNFPKKKKKRKKGGGCGGVISSIFLYTSMQLLRHVTNTCLTLHAVTLSWNTTAS